MTNQNRFKEKRFNQIRITIAFMFFLGFFLISFSSGIFSYIGGIGFFIVIVGIIIGYYYLKFNASQETVENIHELSSYLSLPLIVMSFLFLLVIFVGLIKKRLDIVIVGIVFSLLCLILGLWDRIKSELLK